MQGFDVFTEKRKFRDLINMVEYSTVSDTGNREINEDCVRTAEKNGRFCFVVCDGLGGHGRGEEASQVVADHLIECFDKFGGEQDFLERALFSAQQTLLSEQEARKAVFEMKTTAVILVVSEGSARWGYVGDSRLYMFGGGRLKTRTLDHSVPQMLALAGDIKEKEIRFHADRNKLLRVMGIKWADEQFVISDRQQLRKKQAFLLCTDGFWELIDEKAMTRTLRHSKNPKEWLDGMTEQVKIAGAGRDMDNFSAIAVFA